MNLLDIFENSDDLARFPAGGIILTEGQEGNNMYVVLDGEVTISLKSRLLATARVGKSWVRCPWSAATSAAPR